MTTLRFKFSKALLTGVAMLWLQVSYAQGLKGDSWAEVKASKSGTITFTYIETPGLSYKDGNGMLTGICVDVMYDFVRFLEKSKGIKLNFKFEGESDNFRNFYSNVKSGSGGVFGLGNIAITESRKKEVNFSPAYITSFPMLVSHSSVETLKDLKTISTTFKFMKAYVTKGTVNEKRILELKTQYFPDLTVLNTTSSLENLQKIMLDDNSFGYVDVMFYLDAVKKKMPIKRHSVGDKAAEEFGIIMPTNSDWDDIIREFFAANGGYKNSPEYKKIIIKHLGATGAKLLESAPKGNT